MPIQPAEEWFVRCLILRQRRERVLYELSHPDKRRWCLWNLTAAGNDRLDPRRIHDLPQPIMPDELLTMLRSHRCKASTPVYVLKGDGELDGQTLPLKDVLTRLWAFPPYALIAREQGIVLIAGESGGYAPWRALLI